MGSRPHLSGVYDARSRRRGAGPLGRFWETFIAPNQIRFLVENDFVDGLDVVRDLTIEITMAPGVVVHTPMHLLYELREEAGELNVVDGVVIRRCIGQHSFECQGPIELAILDAEDDAHALTLARRAVARLGEESGVRLSLSVLKVNPALALYKRLGFRVVGETGYSYEMQNGPR